MGRENPSNKERGLSTLKKIYVKVENILGKFAGKATCVSRESYLRKPVLLYLFIFKTSVRGAFEKMN
jgi:hypothetical protein